MEIISKSPKSKVQSPKFKEYGQAGMSLIVVMAAMTLFAIALLAVAPTVQQGIQREKELEQIRRGEEVADAIKQYVIYYRGAKLPTSMDDLLEGLPQGTKKRQILRPSAAVDPLSADGKWRLISPTSKAFINFGKRVQIYNNGVLPGSPGKIFDDYAIKSTTIINDESDSDIKEADDEEFETSTEGTTFIGVASQSRSSSVIAYYGIENHSKWVFTPLFRSTGATSVQGRNAGAAPNANVINSVINIQPNTR
ncbi:hypothetical protein BH20ACI1_BH20ACI1_14430 [soil metagenome]